MTAGYAFGEYQLRRVRGPLIYRAQCGVCGATGPHAATRDAAIAWTRLHLHDEPTHTDVRELRSIPYRLVRP